MPAIITVLVGLGQSIALLLAILWLYRLIYPHERTASSRLSALMLGGLVGGLDLLGIAIPIAGTPGFFLNGQMLLVALASAWAGPFAALAAGSLGVFYRLWLGGPTLGPIGGGNIMSGAMLGTLAWYWSGRRPLLRPSALLLLGFVSAVVSLLWALLLPADIAEPALTDGAISILVAYPIVALILGTLFAQDLRRAGAEAALRISETRYRTLASHLPNSAVLLFNHELRFTLAEGVGLAEVGLSRASLEGKTIWEVFPANMSRALEAPFRAALANTPLITEVHFQERVYRVHTLPMLDPHGCITAGMAMAQDITADRRAQTALKESEERYARLSDATFEGIGFCENNIIFDANPRLAEMLGYTQQELIGMPTDQLVAPESRDLVRRRVLSGYQRLYEHLAQHKDGSVFPVEVRSRQLSYQGRNIRVTVVHDIRKLVAAQQALAASELRFRVLFHSSPAPQSLTQTDDGTILDVNTAFERLLGWPRAELVGERTAELPIWLDLDQAQLLDMLHAQRRISDKPIRLRTRSGAIRDLNFSVERVQVGEQSCLLNVMIDVTARKRAEEELRLMQTATLAISTTRDLSAALGIALEQVCEATGWVLGQAWMPHADGTVLVCSAAWWSSIPDLDSFRHISETTAFQIGEGLPGRVWQSKEAAWVQNVTLDASFPRAAAARAAGLKAGMAFPVLAGADVVAVLEFFVHEPREEDAQLINLISTVAAQLGTVIQRKQAEDALRASEARYRQIVETAEEGIWALDRANITTFVNPKLASWLGYKVDEMVGQPMFAFLDADERARVAAQLARQGQGIREQYEVRFWGKDGAARWALVSASPIEDQQGGYTGALAMLTDITARRQAEAALRGSEARFRAMFEWATIGIALMDLTGRPIISNPALEALLGYSADELRNMAFSTFTHPDDVDMDLALFDELMRGTRESYQIEKRYLRKDSQVVWGHLTVSLVRGSAAEPLFAIGMVEDITERKRIEQQYRQAQKMDAIGRLAGGVAHDFNNLLTVILGSSELLLDELGPDHPLCSDIVPIQDAAVRASALTRQLLAFSRQQVLQPDIVNLNTVVTSVEKLLRRLISEDITLVTRLAEHLGNIRADPNQLEQVLLNLAVNARDAMPSGGTLIIETANVMLDANLIHEHGEVTSGPYVLLALSDTGCGMDEATQARIFEPFFTTKAPGKGTGLGLATVYGIVQQSGGYIWVYSEVGYGTTFKIHLPQKIAPAETIQPLPDLALAPQDTGVILLVEDEPLVRVLTSRILRARGYEVLEADDGPTALRIAAGYQGRIDVLLTDVIMPGGLSGPQVAELLLVHQPGLRVLYMSGYTDTAIAHHATFDSRQNLLQKPFTSGGLAHAVWNLRHAREQERSRVDANEAGEPHGLHQRDAPDR